jgi:hypothetical protein
LVGPEADPLEPLMNPHLSLPPRWSTAAYGDPADTSPGELSALGEHLNLCRGSQGRWFGLHCAAERMNGIVAPRFITTLLVVTMMIAAALLVL